MNKSKGPLPSPVLQSPDEWIEDIHNCPPDIALALACGRPEMLCVFRERPLSPEEGKALVEIIRIIFATNRELAAHCKIAAQLMQTLHGHLKGAVGGMRQLDDFLNFRQPIDDNEE